MKLDQSEAPIASVLSVLAISRATAGISRSNSWCPINHGLPSSAPVELSIPQTFRSDRGVLLRLGRGRYRHWCARTT
jgi:hypothetical protein